MIPGARQPLCAFSGNPRLHTCWFCDGRGVGECYDSAGHYVMCPTCGANGPVKPTNIEAVAAWNREPITHEQIAAAEEALRATRAKYEKRGSKRRAGMTGVGQSEGRKTPMSVAEQQGSAAAGDPAQFVEPPVGGGPEPARLGGRAPAGVKPRIQILDADGKPLV